MIVKYFVFLLVGGMCVLSAPVSGAETPAERQIEQARRIIAAGHPPAQTYNELALALTRRARETSDPKFFVAATEALGESFGQAPDNFDGQKVRIWILLGRHEFAQALREAAVLSKRVPDDLTVYGMLVDAHIELGNYRDAEVAAQWMLDLRPGNVAGLIRAARLRELFGDLEGALELMSRAYERTPPVEVEDRAWLLTRLAHVQLLGGRLKPAGAALAEALRLFPGYHDALGELAKVRTEEKRHSEAVDLLRQRLAGASQPETLFSLGEALERDGREREARAVFEEFETKARAEMDCARNANRELVYYYVDHARRAAEALRIAEKEMARRPDAFVRGAYAWALFANERATEARQQMELALAVGLRDPLLLEHARRLGVKPPSTE